MLKNCVVCTAEFKTPKSRDKTCSAQCANKLRAVSKTGDKNPSWKGDFVGMGGLHEYIRKHKPKPEKCERCNIAPPYDLANISQEYRRDVNDFEWLCRKCHINGDGRVKKLVALARMQPNKYFLHCVECKKPRGYKSYYPMCRDCVTIKSRKEKRECTQ